MSDHPPLGFEAHGEVSLLGLVERITFENPDTGYVVARLRVGSTKELITVVGPLAGIRKGEELEVHGVWESDPRYGPQVMVKSFKSNLGSGDHPLLDYLTTFYGIGRRRAKALEEHFGAQLATVIEESPDKLREVKGISKPIAERLQTDWKARASERQVMVFCQSHGLTLYQSRAIFKEYGDRALHILTTNPYRIAEDVYGIGFKKADEIALKLGIEENDPRRVEAALIYTLHRGGDDGHCFLPLNQLLLGAENEVGAPSQLVLEALDRMLREERLVSDPDIGSALAALGAHEENDPSETNPPIYLKRPLEVERLLANDIALRLVHYAVEGPLPPAWEAALQLHRQRQGIELSGEQEAAIRQALTAPVMLLTGGPGTGKSTCLKLAVDVLEAQQQLVSLCAPTGRAAKRLSETTGREALTIHRLLEFNPKQGGFQRNDKNPLVDEVVIVDESSMLDTSLALALCRALPPKCRLFLVGDPDQLPSVGAGNVLADLIASGAVPRAHLSQIFRQAEASSIVVNAHRINAGEMPDFTPNSSRRRDCLFKQVSEDKVTGPQEAAALVIETVVNGFTASGFDPIRMVQVLTPMHNGPVGARALNTALQEALNPVRHRADSIKAGYREFRRGDRVMQVRNNYDKDVFNGDIGFVIAIDRDADEITILFDNPVTYRVTELDEVQLAYAITVHKAQGSEFPVVVMPLVTQHYLMLQRTLLYTALTRAKKVAVLVGQKKALWIAVQRGRETIGERRFTALNPRLREAVEDAKARPRPTKAPPPAPVQSASLVRIIESLLAEEPFAAHGFLRVPLKTPSPLIYRSREARVALVIEDPSAPPVAFAPDQETQVLRFTESTLLASPGEVRAAVLGALPQPPPSPP